MRISLLVKKLIITILFLFPVIALSDSVTLGSGKIGKGYNELAKSIKKIFISTHQNFSIVVKETAGSAENLDLLANGDIDIAIVQSDTAFYAENGLHHFKGNAINDLQSLFLFYQEPIFIITRFKNINTISQLQNMKVNVGLNNSGLQVSAKVLLTSANIWELINTYNNTTKSSIDLLLNKKLDAIFLNSINDAVKKKIKNRELYIVPISKYLVDNLKSTFPFFSSYSYKIDEIDQVSTLSVTAMLVTRSNFDAGKSQTLVELLDNNFNSLVSPSDSIVIKEHFTSNPLNEWHVGVQSYSGSNLDKKTFDVYMLYAVISILIFGLIATFLAFIILQNSAVFHHFHGTHTFLRFIRIVQAKVVSHKYISLTVAMGLLYLAFIFLIRFFEHNWALENNTFSPFDAHPLPKLFSWLFILSSAGFDDGLFPKSEEGKLIVSLAPLLGMGGVIALVGLVTVDHVKNYFLEVNGMAVQKITNHVIICGWNSKAHLIIENLLHDNLLDKKQIVVLANIDDDTGISKYDFDPMYVYYVKGIATKKEDLERANASKANLAVVIPDELDQDPDAKVILKLLTINKYCDDLREKGEKCSDINTVVELLDDQNISIAKDAGADQIVSLNNIQTKIFTQAIRNPGVAAYIDRILTFDDKNEIYSYELKENNSLIGKNYDEIMFLLREKSIQLMGINLKNRGSEVELQKKLKKYNLDNHLITNPYTDSTMKYKVQKRDLLIVLAQDEKQVIKNLKE